MTGTPTVLFVCPHNANRSQIAAGYLQHLAGDRVNVLSAGPRPSDALNPAAVEAMAEEGIRIDAAVPALLTPETVDSADVVITLGCADTVAVAPGRRHEDWQLEAPPGQGLDAARSIREQIKRRVQDLASELFV
jgi:arsenate reductase (thioredoxin)